MLPISIYWPESSGLGDGAKVLLASLSVALLLLIGSIADFDQMRCCEGVANLFSQNILAMLPNKMLAKSPRLVDSGHYLFLYATVS